MNAALLQRTHYQARNEQEKRLDRRVNLKLDLIVVSLLAIEFIVSFTLEENTCCNSHVLTSAVLWHRQDQCRLYYY